MTFFFISAGTAITAITLFFVLTMLRIANAGRHTDSCIAGLSSVKILRYAAIFEDFWTAEMPVPLEKDNFTAAILKIINHFKELEYKFAVFFSISYKFYYKTLRKEKNEKYFFGLGTIAAGCFIGEALKARCGGSWIKENGMMLLQIPGIDERFSPVNKLAELRFCHSAEAMDELEHYLLKLAALPQK